MYSVRVIRIPDISRITKLLKNYMQSIPCKVRNSYFWNRVASLSSRESSNWLVYGFPFLISYFTYVLIINCFTNIRTSSCVFASSVARLRITPCASNISSVYDFSDFAFIYSYCTYFSCARNAFMKRLNYLW